MNKQRLCATLAGILLLMAAAERAHGQQTQSVGLAPAYIEADVKRGSSYVQEFTVVNKTSTRLRFRCTVGDFWYDEKGERLFGRPGTLPRSASSWVQFTPTEVVVEPMSSGVVKAVITVPAAAEGGYYVMPFFEGEPAELPDPSKFKDSTAHATVAVRLGGLLMLATTVGSQYNVEVKGGHIVPPTPSSELELHLEVDNHSNTHVLLHGTFAFLDAGGRVAGRGQIEEQRYLPGQHYSFKAPWAGELAPGHYTAVITLKYARAATEPASLVYEIPFDVKP